MNALEQFTPLMDAVISHINEGVILTDYKGKVLFHNPAADELLGFPEFRSVHEIHETTGVNLQLPAPDSPDSSTLVAAHIDLASSGRHMPQADQQQRRVFTGS